MSRAVKDFIAFVDSGSKVPFYVKEAKYSSRPHAQIVESFALDNKTYCQTRSNTYFVSVVIDSLVRYITAQDFLRAKDDYKKQQIENDISKIQLVMDFC